MVNLGSWLETLPGITNIIPELQAHVRNYWQIQAQPSKSGSVLSLNTHTSFFCDLPICQNGELENWHTSFLCTAGSCSVSTVSTLHQLKLCRLSPLWYNWIRGLSMSGKLTLQAKCIHLHWDFNRRVSCLNLNTVPYSRRERGIFFLFLLSSICGMLKNV